ncbi:DNA glycosylase AlkZ-like family protein [Desertibaculum subflavum]|uniref:DNA glycosylase AlkZ-like family protein n=1 Tax=Desertibaculum subflavum TaxID=2268458 RepID=UPI000E66A1BD
MPTPTTLNQIRARVFAQTLGPAAKLGPALEALGFVQADPIRAPARAQDLILRHRVAGYRAGDLERRFAKLPIEEDYLYAYGFLPRGMAALLHPRRDIARRDGVHKPKGLAAEVLAHVRDRGPTHPAALEASFGRARTLNGWGQQSKATTRALHFLQHYGLLRVVRRDSGIRVYEAVSERPPPLTPDERARAILRLVLRLQAPATEAGLGHTFGLLRRGAPGLGPFRPLLAAMLKSGEIETAEIEGLRYLWLAGDERPGVPRRLRLLAPFDPIVWERRRFEHLFGFDYRLEAYTPPKKRRFGYYALPLAWGDRVIGWANVAMTPHGIDAKLGFAGREPKGQDFRRSLDAELARMQSFLGAER